MRYARTRRSSMSVAATCFLVMCGAGNPAVAKELGCPEIGAVYRPDPEIWDKHSFYRLRIDSRPLADDPLQHEEIWRFQGFDHDTKKKILELRLLEYCPTGGPCVIGLTDQGTDISSDVVRVTNEFRESTDYLLRAPRAIILPGFAQQRWLIDKSYVERGYLSLYSDKRIYPELIMGTIWNLVSCGHK